MRVEVRRHSAQTPWTYAQLDARQRAIAEEVRAGGVGAILLSEVAPVITRGRRAPESDLLWPEAEYASRGIELARVNRGGLATYHGPGQWVLFVVESLERLTGDRRGVRRAVEFLLEAAREAITPWRSGAEIRRGCDLGVWEGSEKLASLGIEIDQGVLLHGVAVNGRRIAPAFLGLRPCGLDAPVGFTLSQVQGRDEAEFVQLGEELVRQVRVKMVGKKEDQ